MSGLTPMMRQFKEIKQQHPEAILLFRLGDFYEMFGSDAELASRELDLVLTGREAGAAGKVPMCGFPHHSADGYIARLVDKGYRVAICEQTEDPKQTKGLVKREVVRTITPGTILDSQVLPEKRSNYLMALVPQWQSRKKRSVNSPPTEKAREEATELIGIGLALIEASTGEFLVTEFHGERIWERTLDELVRLEPAEILFDADILQEKLTDFLAHQHTATLTRFPIGQMDLKEAQRILNHHFKTISLDGFGCADLTAGLIAGAGLLQFLQETQKTVPQHIEKIKAYTTEQFMLLDWFTRRNLELTSSLLQTGREGSLLGVLDRTVTAMGGRRLRSWIDQPLQNIKTINERLDSVEFLVNDYFLRTKIREILDKIYDLERLLGRVAYGTASARDLVGLRSSLQMVPLIREALEECDLSTIELASGSFNTLRELLGQLDPLEDVVNLLERAIVEEPPLSVREGGVIRSHFNPEVDRLREASGGGKQWMANLEGQERARTGIKSLKVGFNKVFGYYIEVTNANLGQVPEDYQRKQTLANAERFITPELKEYEVLILGAEEQVKDLEYRLFVQVRDQVNQQARRILQTAHALAELDVLVALAEVAVENNYCKPVVHLDRSLSIKDARHPVVEKNLVNQAYVPNDINLDPSSHCFMLITGPNMGGKSTYCRSIALICLMAQIGSFVPAREAEIGLVDRIFARIGASDDLGSGKSTFMVEMNEVGNIVNNATSRSLIILDEVGRGTSTYDGLSIAWALTEYIHNVIEARTLFATHYHELTQLELILPRVKNYNVAVREQGEDIIFLHRVVSGGADRSYGIQVARLAGLPGDLIQRAQHILHELEQRHSGPPRETSPEKVITLIKGGNEDAAGKQRLTERILTAKKTKRLAGSVKETSGDQAVSPMQLSLLEWDKHPILEEILGLDLMNMTPLAALNQLFELQQKLRRR
ncbi:MAG: DNA mismatch repair protein MutS [Syntrophomonadaceae bacterium]|nr:DNA mismatch repair protein MutS [Syntrophomonadaceae bacterium]